jgi:hypothetical protein
MADILFAEIDALMERVAGLEAELQTAHEIGARHAKRVGEQALELQALREGLRECAEAAMLPAPLYGSRGKLQALREKLAALLEEGDDG